MPFDPSIHGAMQTLLAILSEDLACASDTAARAQSHLDHGHIPTAIGCLLSAEPAIQRASLFLNAILTLHRINPANS